MTKFVGKKIFGIITLGLFIVSATGIANVAMAASLTSLSDTISSSKISTLSNHEIKFVTPTGVDASTDTITITFPVGFTMGTFAVANVDIASGSTNNCSSATFTEKTIASSATNNVWGAAQSGQVITFTAPTNASSGEITADRCVRIRIGSNAVTGSTGTTQITNPSSATTYSISIAGVFGDTGSITVPILSDDQVSVTATVPQSLTFSISDNTIGFGTLSSGAASYATGDTNGSASETGAHDVVAGTNAVSGYTITVKGATLTFGANTITAIGGTNTASSAGSEQFGLRMVASGGSGSVTAPYAASGFAYAADANTTSQVASATGASADTTYSTRYLANISSVTEAGAYSATLTYSATANF